MTPTPATGPSSVTGSVAYRDRSALPPDAEVEVWIVDISPGMMIQSIVGQTTVKSNGRQVPIPFELTFDPARIEPTHVYGLKAVIKSGGKTLYQSTQEYRVITQANPVNLAVMVTRPMTDAPGSATSLEGTAWRLEDLGGAGVVDRIEATIEFLVGGKVAGKGSCNRFFGTATVNGPTLTLSQMGSTRMACTPAVNDQETKYLKALEQAQRYAVQGSTLLITYSGSDKPLRFVRAER